MNNKYFFALKFEFRNFSNLSCFKTHSLLLRNFLFCYIFVEVIQIKSEINSTLFLKECLNNF